MTIPAKRRSEAQRLAREGHRQAEISRRLGISRRSVQRFVADLGEPEGERVPALLDPSAPIDGIDPAMMKPSEISRRIASRALQTAEMAEADGNSVVALKAAKVAREASNDLLRAERDARANPNGRVYTDEYLKQVKAQILDRVNRMAASPECVLGVCPRCAAEIRMARASAPFETPAEPG